MFIAKISSKHIVGLGKLIGSFAYLLDIPHRRIVRQNLEFAYPDWSKQKVRSVSRRVFQNLSTTILEFCQLASIPKETLPNRVKVVGTEYLDDALSSQKGLIIVSAHLGNWEFALQYGCCYLQRPILGVAKKLRFAPLNQWVHNLRTRFGIKIIYKKGALPEMRQILRRGGVLALMVDQSRRSEGVDVTFFGHKVTTTPSAAFLAIRCRCPVLPIFCVRDASGQLTIQVETPIEMKLTGDLRSDVQTNTQIITNVVENVVRSFPEQWLWVHKRWKKYYPQLYPEYQARRQRRKRLRDRQGKKKLGMMG